MDSMIEAGVKIFSMSTLRYFLLAGIPFTLFYLFRPARFNHFKIQLKEATKKDFLREIWYSMQSNLVFTAITIVLLFTPIRQYTMIYANIADFPVWYIGVSLVLSLVVHDTYFYWMHRVLHHKSLFKRTHLVHHQSTNPSPWSSYSFHVLEAVAEGMVLVVITCIMPMHPLTVLLFTVSGFIINVYGHLGYELMPKWFRHSWAFEVFNTSVHHNLHHKKFRGNYGLYFRVWDRTMGTEHPDYVKEYDQLQERRFGHKAAVAKAA